jgi:CTP synthase
MEIAELPKTVHPFFLGVQFHPEFLAHPIDPHPVFTAFVEACEKAAEKDTRPKAKR